jgi:uncharacterized membrane protein
MPQAALATAGRSRLGRRAPWVPIAAAIGELVIDKVPQTPSRLDPRGLILRAASSGAAGAELAGAAGAACAVPAALGSAYAGFHLRRAAGRRTGAPDAVWAVLEDGIAVGLAYLALRVAP